MTVNLNVLDRTEKVIFALRSLYQEHGFNRYRMSKFEEYDLYSKHKDFLVSDSVITFMDTSGKLMALKPDVTLSIIKNHKDDPSGLLKLCYNENVYRVRKGTGSFQEIMQTGLECIGNVDDNVIGDVLSLALTSLKIEEKRCLLQVSDLDLLSAVVKDMSDDPDVQRGLIRCAGEKNLHEALSICEANQIPEDKQHTFTRLLSLSGSMSIVMPSLYDLFEGTEKMAIVDQFGRAVSSVGDQEDLQIDFSVISDMNYYNGIVFKGFVEGIPGSVLRGGQYDRLMKKMGRRSGAVGFAVYLDMLNQ